MTAAAADVGRFDVRDLALRARAGGDPVIPLVMELVAAVEPDIRPYVHRGATSQDILDTAAMLVAARTLAPLLDDLARTADAVALLATSHRNTPMAARTLTQHAVPTTFGLKAAGWRALVLDARDRLSVVRESLPAQLGGVAGTLAAFEAYAPTEDIDAIDPGLPLIQAFANELGLAEPLLPWHTLRTPIADLAGALAFTAGALGKTAADVLSLSRTEIGEVTEGQGDGSSVMAHRAGPVHATLIAAAARRAPAWRRRCTDRSSPRTSGRPGRGTPSGSRCANCCGSSAEPRAAPPNSPAHCASSPTPCGRISSSPTA